MPVRKRLALPAEQSIWFENSEPRSEHVGSHRIRFHSLFQHDSWSSDVFVFFHNGVRHELLDLHKMLKLAAHNGSHIHTKHLLTLEKWFVQFSQMVAMYFVVNDNVICPSLVTFQPNLRTTLAKRGKSHVGIINHLLEIHAECLTLTMIGTHRSSAKSALSCSGMGESITRMIRLLHGLISSLEQIFEWEFTELVPIVKERMLLWEARDLIQRCLNEMSSCEVGREVMWGYFRGVPADYKEEFFAAVERLTRMKLRAKEKRWLRQHRRFSSKLSSLQRRRKLGAVSTVDTQIK